MTQYSEKLRDPRWQKKRLEIFERDDFHCQSCFDGEKTLTVHHLRYVYGREPWEYPDKLLTTLCIDCHEIEFEQMKESVNSLIEQVKDRGFLSGHVQDLAAAFNGIVMQIAPEVTASIIKWAFCDKSTMDLLHDKYFEYLKHERANKEKK